MPVDSLTKLRTLWQTHLRLSKVNLPVVDYIAATTLAAFYPSPTPQVWSMVLGPPSIGKTTACDPVIALGEDHVYHATSLTDKTFLSGWTGGGTSHAVAPDLDGKLFYCPDISPIMAMRVEAQANLMSQFRSLYDGKIAAISGQKNAHIRINLRLGMLLCGTNSTDSFLINTAATGGRFTLIRMRLSYREKRNILDHIDAKTSTRHVWLKELDDGMQTLMDIYAPGAKTRAPHSRLPAKYLTRFTSISRVSNAAKTVPEAYNSRAQEKMGNQIEADSPIRLAQQLKLLGTARMTLDGRTAWNASDMSLVARVGWDTIPLIGQRLIAMLKDGKRFTSSEIAARLPHHRMTFLTDILRGWLDVGLVTKDGFRWVITREYYEDIKEAWPVAESYWWPEICYTDRMLGVTSNMPPDPDEKP